LQQLEASDAIIRSRDREIAALNARLAGKDEIIAEAGEQIARLEFEIVAANQKISNAEAEIQVQDAELESLNSELASEKNRFRELSATSIRAELTHLQQISIELPEPADLLNRLKSQRKKSKADLADIEAILEILDK